MALDDLPRDVPDGERRRFEATDAFGKRYWAIEARMPDGMWFQFDEAVANQFGGVEAYLEHERSFYV